MTRIPANRLSGIVSLRLAVALLATALLPLLAYAAAPGWWSQRGVVVANAAQDDFAPANQGQLKNIAKAAVAEMDAKLAGGAGNTLHDLVTNWETPNAQRNDFAPMNVGQLKNMAKPFYDRLVAAGLAEGYPWQTGSQSADDFAVANIGQVKNLFRFELPDNWAGDTDHNGLPDAWETQYFGTIGVDPNADPDGDGASNASEFAGRTNPTAVTDANGDGMPDEWDTDAIGKFVVYPPSVSASLLRGQTQRSSIFLNNPTAQPVNISVALEGNTAAGYSFTDSKSGDVGFRWEEISGTGTRLALISDADEGSEPITLSHFSFPFYGQNYTQVHVSSNGYLTFAPRRFANGNEPLPSASAPSLLVAPFWDDLDPSAAGDIYYKEETDRLIVQYQAVALSSYLGSGAYTFQIILFANGEIEFRYLSLTGEVTYCTIGIQNADGSEGLQVAHRSPYLGNNLAIRFRPPGVPFLEVSPAAGNVSAHAQDRLDVLFHSLSLFPGTYSATIRITHDCPGASPVSIPAVLEVKNIPSAVSMDAPADGASLWEEQSVELLATASDADTHVARIEFYDGSTLLGEGLWWGWNQFRFIWENLPVGSHTITARAIDQLGQASDSAPIRVTGRPDPDEDGDGLRSSEEKAAGTDPLDSDSDDDGLSDGEEVLQVGTNPLLQDSDGNGVEDRNEDADGDGLSNSAELRIHHTDPSSDDTDSDASKDGEEVAAGSEPNDAASYPPRFRDVGRGLEYHFKTTASWSSRPSRQLIWTASWSDELRGSEELSPVEPPYVQPTPFTELAGILAANIPFPAEIPPGPNYGGWWLAGDTSIASVSFPGETPWFDADVSQRRIWVHRNPATDEEVKRTVLVVRTRQLNEVWQPEEVRVETMILPAGQKSSNPIDLLTGFTLNSTGNDNNSESVSETLLPVEMKQLNYPTTADSTDLGATAEKIIDAGGIAYITGAPEMPKLEARIWNGSFGMTVEWHMDIKSERTERGTKDDLRLPTTGVIEVPIAQPWKIYPYYIAPAEFFGGKCTVYYRLKGASGYLGAEQKFEFKIRGKNPKDSDAKGYIANTQGSYRFSWAIAQHESREPSTNRIYNQFNASGSLLELPNYSHDQKNGWGIFQRDDTNGGIYVDTQQVYSWKQNAAVYYAEMTQKEAAQIRFFEAIASAYPNDPEAQTPPTSFTPPNTGRTMTALESGYTTLYNGAGGCPTTKIGSTIYTNPWHFYPQNASGLKWTYTPNSNNYLYKVIHEEFEHALPANE